jgi:hypothetical protein
MVAFRGILRHPPTNRGSFDKRQIKAREQLESRGDPNAKSGPYRGLMEIDDGSCELRSTSQIRGCPRDRLRRRPSPDALWETTSGVVKRDAIF